MLTVTPEMVICSVNVMSPVTVMSALSTWHMADNLEKDSTNATLLVGADVGAGVNVNVGAWVTVGARLGSFAHRQAEQLHEN